MAKRRPSKPIKNAGDELRYTDLKYLLLTDRDEFVPASHIPLYALFIEPEQSRDLFSVDTGELRRKAMYKNVLAEFKRVKADNFANFWNYYAFEIVASGMVEFHQYEPLEGLCQYIECFERKLPNRKKTGLTTHISFGLNKHVIKSYFDAKQEAEATGVEFVPPPKAVRYPAPIMKTDFYKEVVHASASPANASIKDARVFLQRIVCNRMFKHWALLNKLTYSQAMVRILQDFFENNEFEGMHPPEFYENEESVLEAYADVPRPATRDVNVTVGIGYEMALTMERIIKNYNNAYENKGKPLWSMSSYIKDAIALLNTTINLKYSNPKLYRQIKDEEVRAALAAEREERQNG